MTATIPCPVCDSPMRLTFDDGIPKEIVDGLARSMVCETCARKRHPKSSLPKELRPPREVRPVTNDP